MRGRGLGLVVARDSQKRYLRTARHRLVLPPVRGRRDESRRGTTRGGRPTLARPRGRSWLRFHAGTGVEPVTARLSVWCSAVELPLGIGGENNLLDNPYA